MKRLIRTWAEIDLDNLAHNYNEIRARVGKEVQMMAVVKANGYGHGDIQAARTLDRCGAEWFGVSNVLEARALRRGGITKPILVLGYTPVQNARDIFELSLTQCVFSEEYAEQLADAARKENLTLDCHLKLDTGMNRLGFDTHEPAELVLKLARICYLPNLKVNGVFTHFAMADEDTDEGRYYTAMQHRRFANVLDELGKKGFRFPFVHCCNSAGIFNYPDYHHNMVRPGIALYGLWPGRRPIEGVDLKPVMTLKSVVAMTKELPSGEKISYGGTYEAFGNMKVATVPIGYADGYPRSLSNRGYAYVGEKVVPVVGRICMDQLMLDVTGLDVQVGDEVILFGGHSPIGAENIAGMTGTISYEIVCDIACRVQKVYMKDGEVYDTVDFP